MINLVGNIIEIILTRKRHIRRKLIFAARIVIALIIFFILYNELYCYIAKAFSSKIIPNLAQLKLSTYGITRSSSVSKDLITILIPKLSSKLVLNLKDFDSNFSDKFQTSLLILHTEDHDEDDLKSLFNNIKREIVFLNIKSIFTLFPNGFDSCRTKSSWHVRGKWNYQLMIRFWFKIIFQLPQLQQYQYVMRLDDDSKIIGKWINIFDEMRSKDAVYFANNIDLDEERQLPGTMQLKQVTFQFLEEKNIIPKQPQILNNTFGQNFIRTYFNNFEVLKLEFFRRENVRQWIETIDQTYGIFKYRWGDAVLRYITMALFAEQHQILHRYQYNLSYCHKC